MLNNDDGLATRVSMMRGLNFLIIGTVLTQTLIFSDEDWFGRIARSLIVVYFAMLLTQIINFFVRQRFGKARHSNNKILISDTYSSCGLSVLVTAVISVIAIISCYVFRA